MAARLLYHQPKGLAEQKPEGKVTPVTLPIGHAEVSDIASGGFPLKENLATLKLRNKRITVAYESLSIQLIDLLAQGTDVRRANWCTFGAWSSRTIGCSIDPDEFPEFLREFKALPFPGQINWVLQKIVRRDHGSIFRALAAGNRFIFLEIGSAIAHFINDFSNGLAFGPEAEDRWHQYWDRMQTMLDEMNQLDPSWVPTNPGNPDLMRAGLRQYFDAIRARSDDERSERILAGNLLLGAYEQFRADGYVLTSFAIRGDAAFRRLLVRGTGRSHNPIRYIPTLMYTALMTRFALVLITPHEVVRIGKALQPPMLADRKRRLDLFSRDVFDLDVPLLQAVLSRYDLSDFRRTKRGAKNWTRYYERMHFIANLFRSRHDDPCYWTTPLFDDATRDELLAGRLPATTRFPRP